MIGNHDVPRFVTVAAGDGTDPADPPPQPEDEEPIDAPRSRWRSR
jgi:hypothetical protein